MKVEYRQTNDADKFSLVIVIPTKNRVNELKSLAEDLSSLEIAARYIIVDSSDLPLRQGNLDLAGVVVMRSRLKSAAHQRNLALREIYTNFIYTDCHFILFLDDDVRINRDFAKKLIDNLLQWKDAVGVSPLVNDGRGSPSMVEKILPGKVLPGAINISSNGFEEETKVDWLIGCSLWRLDALRERRFYFEGDLLGQSIFEDVIFSTHLRMTGGSLIVSKVPLIHNLSKSERPNSRESMSEWILNRYRYVDLFDNSLIVFLLVNLGMCLRQIVGIASKERRQSLQGIITGTQRVLRSL